MKITKITISIFFLAFLVGYVAVPQEKRFEKKIQINISAVEQLPPDENTAKPEVIQENQDEIKDELKFKIKLLETGYGFHGDEIEAKSGEAWLGLFNENGEHFLKFTKIKIRRVHDPVVDGYEEKLATQKTGKSVTVDNKTAPLFLLKNARELNEGEITTLFRGFTMDEADGDEKPVTSLEKGFKQDYQIDGKNYVLQVKEFVNEKNEPILALFLESDGIKQILHTMKSEYTNSLGILYWVGDLDRDKKPDCFLELYVHDNALYRNLYFSSKAKKGKLVEKVAVFTTTGC